MHEPQSGGEEWKDLTYLQHREWKAHKLRTHESEESDKKRFSCLSPNDFGVCVQYFVSVAGLAINSHEKLTKMPCY